MALKIREGMRLMNRQYHTWTYLITDVVAGVVYYYNELTLQDLTMDETHMQGMIDSNAWAVLV